VAHLDLIGRWPKLCARCSAAHSERDWNGLPLADRAPLGVDAEIELRRCRCGGLLAMARAARDPSAL
jgi:hypothetical protein